MTRVAASIALMLVVLLGATVGSSASQRLCRQLEAQLASGGARFSPGKYDAAIERQRDQMALAQEQRDDAGCGFAIAGRNIRQCARLNSTIAKMERNLATLQRDRRRAGGSLSRKERNRILAALEANNCRNPEPQQEQAAEERAIPEPNDEASDSSGQDRLRVMLDEFGQRQLTDEPAAFPGEAPEVAEVYRTMCVRTCDGYFFPMSTASTVSDFERDEKRCETSCPGAEMEVFYGPRDTDRPGQMLSIRDGAPYSALPTAFRHQQTSIPRPAGCSCAATRDPNTNFTITAGTPPAQSNGQDATGAEAPDPGTTNRESGSFIAIVPPKLDPPPIQPPTAETRPQKDDEIEREAGDRNIRVVGPKFLPDPGAAIDLRAPAQRSGP